MSWAECSSCGHRFTSDAAFDRHLSSPTSDKENCFPPESILDKNDEPVVEVVQRASGPHWRIRRDDPHYLAVSDSPVAPDSPARDSAGTSAAKPSERPRKSQKEVA